MRKINQPIVEEHETSPPKITTKHSHTSGSNHEIDLSRESQTKVNNDAMAVDEEVHDSEGGSPNVDGTNTAAFGGDNAQDEELREDEEEYQPLFHERRPRRRGYQ